MRSYRPEELFDAEGRPLPKLQELAPKGTRRMGANPAANGGVLLKELRLPDFRNYALDVPKPGAVSGEATRVMGTLLRDVMRMNHGARNFRVFGPDETTSNRLGALFEVTDRTWLASTLQTDEHLARDGRVMEMPRSSTAAPASASGSEPPTTTATNPTWYSPAPAMCRPWRRWRLLPCCGSSCRH